MGENTNEKNKNKKKTEKNNNKTDNTNKNNNKPNNKTTTNNNNNNKTNNNNNNKANSNNNNKASNNNNNNKANNNNNNNKANSNNNNKANKNNNNKTANNNKANSSKANNNNNNKASNKSNNKKKSSKCTKACLSGLKSLFYLLLVIVFCTHGLLPVFFWTFPEISNFVIFSNRLKWTVFANLSDPHSFGLDYTRNFFLQSKRNIKLGAWHILPDNLRSKGKDFSDNDFEKSLQKSDAPIVMYMHGNSGSRACGHRVKLYHRLSQMNYHIITFDYRGFGESTGIPFEDGVVEDSLFVYNWIRSKVSPDTPIILWGHSLGTGIATRLAKILCDGGMPPSALVLESPFNNILEASANLPPFSLYRPFRPLSYMILSSVERCGTEFASDQNIKDVTSPILILHAEDDGLIPIKLAMKVWNHGPKPVDNCS
ncbi:Hypothetical predicted protein [Octopus vulgaris]|uniref:Serine aminopeptidase S33 domain-containing protein n=1 Tax=Octopus vulgaris TaxID=6645 RepID=A0AA36BA36_OCTVU|nr:Hypothetical predicted protein [Octopus vulgaris]